MMRKWTKIVIGTLLFLGALALAMPWICGYFVQQSLLEQLNPQSDVGYRYELQHYHRGWFQSQVNFKLVITNPQWVALLGTQRLHKPLILNLKAKIYHGPFILPGFGRQLNSPFLGLAYAEGTLSLPNNSPFIDFVTNRTLADSHFTLNFNGNSQSYWHVQSIDVLNGQGHQVFAIKQGQLTVDKNQQLDEIKKNIQIKNLLLRIKNKELGVNNLTLKLRFQKDKPLLQAKSIFLQVPLITLTQDADTFLLAKNFIVTFKRDVLDQVINSNLNVQLQELLFNDERFGPLLLNLIVNNIDEKAVTQFNELADRYYKEAALLPLPLSYFYEFKKLMPNLLYRGAQLRVNPFEIDLPSGRLSMTAIVTFPDLSGQAMVNLGELYSKANISVALQIPKVFMHSVTEHYYSLLHERSQQSQKRSPKEETAELLQQFELGKILIPVGDYYRVMAAYQGGIVYLNGRPLQLENF